jgi:hypothetical protein
LLSICRIGKSQNRQNINLGETILQPKGGFRMLEDFANVAVVIGVIIGLSTLILAYRHLKCAVHTNQGQFLLKLEEISAFHNEIHLKLRPDGEWFENNSGPSCLSDWAKLDDYMGFFEHCEILMEKGSLEFSDFESIFGYRVDNIIDNKLIVKKKLIKEKAKWCHFLGLLRRMKRELPEV